MKRFPLPPLAVLIGLGILSGCGDSRPSSEPPPARVEVIEGAPSNHHVWVEGHWVRRHGDWEWEPGHWAMRPREGATWVPGHYVHRYHGTEWVPGHWRD